MAEVMTTDGEAVGARCDECRRVWYYLAADGLESHMETWRRRRADLRKRKWKYTNDTPIRHFCPACREKAA